MAFIGTIITICMFIWFFSLIVRCFSTGESGYAGGILKTIGFIILLFICALGIIAFSLLFFGCVLSLL